ncbi:2-oxoglutarate (2OG) and Fe(II)-dependent oxygenase superfamily protein [Quillaja saponaria]|uniref:2-oxoglutarate (2OG) and Fe(II)-dependent oxygenase superfamily protein n=1 Tax=Quillaja saponaria TaxID=32244 RepID=A0AAD7P5B2_QUISA|nr:2-oxoglutarate (2OG) and Fe(II)-dependent oxygenase superfamily protein [Quillaja saponaria]
MLPRLFIHSYLSLEECKELEFIHKSSSTEGYRPNVFSTIIPLLIATNSSHLIMPIIPFERQSKTCTLKMKYQLSEYFDT